MIGSAMMRSIQAPSSLAPPATGHMVRSFSIQNGLPSLATRKCAMKGGRPDRTETAIAEVAITGAAAASNKKPAARSSVSGSEKVPAARDASRPRLMVDTANS
jgi:hypothetical protein